MLLLRYSKCLGCVTVVLSIKNRLTLGLGRKLNQKSCLLAQSLRLSTFSTLILFSDKKILSQFDAIVFFSNSSTVKKGDLTEKVWSF